MAISFNMVSLVSSLVFSSLFRITTAKTCGKRLCLGMTLEKFNVVWNYEKHICFVHVYFLQVLYTMERVGVMVLSELWFTLLTARRTVAGRLGIYTFTC